nr:1-phosphofructokinase family hexose kinase [uncultured Mucilaginibacter sp.]
MKHIVTVTFNPAVDKSTTVEKLVPTHKMKASEPVYHAGGGGVNVARALKMLGLPATAVYFEGGNTGEFFSCLLTEEGVDIEPVKTQGATRENFIVNELSTNRQFRFGLPGPFISAAELDEMLDKISGIPQIDYLVISGSVPPTIPITIFKNLKAIADEKKAKLVVDTSGGALSSALSSGVYLIKPSLSEMAELAGKEKLEIPEAIEAAKQMIALGQCSIVVLSLGSDGAMMITDEFTLQVAAPPVQVLSTVGAGDSMLAGILFALANDKGLSTALEYGVACGTSATTKHGTSLCEKDMVEELFEKISTHPVY